MPERSDPLVPNPLGIRPPDQTHRYTLFLSSSDEVAKLRDRVEGLVHRAFNPKLEEVANAHIRLRRWEQEMPQKAPQQRVNEIFVGWVRQSHLTLVLLQSHLGKGTQEELEAALAEEGVGLAVIRFAPRPAGRSAGTDKIGEFLKAHQDSLLYEESGLPGSEEAWQSLVKTLFGFAMQVTEESRRSRDAYGELR